MPQIKGNSRHQKSSLTYNQLLIITYGQLSTHGKLCLIPMYTFIMLKMATTCELKQNEIEIQYHPSFHNEPNWTMDDSFISQHSN